MTIWTVGHSNRTLAEFLSLLRRGGIQTLVDVRSVPRSERFPWFGQEELEQALRDVEVEYWWVPKLGGRRSAGLPRSPNRGLQDDAFRNFADYMGAAEFHLALGKVLLKAARSRSALMCSEADPRKCHRGLISDALLAQEVEVIHLLYDAPDAPHTLSLEAVVDSHRSVTYPPVRAVQGSFLDV